MSKFRLLLPAVAIVVIVALILTTSNTGYLSHAWIAKTLFGDGAGGGHGFAKALLGDGAGGGHGIIRTFLAPL